MPLRRSPGCDCCGPRGCEDIRIGYTPTNELSRGLWDGTPQWTPDTAFFAGDRFLQYRLEDNRYCAWEAPTTLQTGSGWTQFEQDRYTLVSVVDVIDEIAEWIPIGTGWESLSAEQYEQAFLNGYLFQDCGFISRDNVLPSTDLNWSVSFNYLYPSRFDADIRQFVLDGDRLSFGLYAAVFDEETYRNGVQLQYSYLQPGEYPVQNISIPGCNGFNSASPWNKQLLLRNQLLDQTWAISPNVPLIATTSQPVGGNVVGTVDPSESPISLESVVFSSPGLFAHNRWFQAYVVLGSGDFYVGTYDPENNTNRLSADAGDVLVVLNPEQPADITSYNIIRENEIITEPILFGGGMRLYAPPDIPNGKRVAIYCDTVENVNPVQFNGLPGVGMKFSGVQAIKVRQVDEPYCRTVQPSACPCPGDTEIYPVTLSEGLNRDYTAIDTILPRPDDQGRPIGSLIRNEEMGTFEYSMLRSGLCRFQFLKLKAWEWVWYEPGALRSSTRDDLDDLYRQRITLGYEFGELDIEPTFNRNVIVSARVTVGLYSLPENLVFVPQGVPPDLITFEQLQQQWPCQFWRLQPDATTGTGPLFHYAASKEVAIVPYEDFTCSYVIAGNYDINSILSWWNEPLLGPPPENQVLGLPWTITM